MTYAIQDCERSWYNAIIREDGGDNDVHYPHDKGYKPLLSGKKAGRGEYWGAIYPATPYAN